MQYNLHIGDRVRSTYPGATKHNKIMIIVDILDENKWKIYQYKYGPTDQEFVYLVQMEDGSLIYDESFDNIPDNQSVYSGEFLRLIKCPDYMKLK